MSRVDMHIFFLLSKMPAERIIIFGPAGLAEVEKPSTPVNSKGNEIKIGPDLNNRERYCYF